MVYIEKAKNRRLLMARITKNPEERKTEIMDAAEKLFFEKGFDRTSVSEIVRTVGIAQGTFYYYFKAKDDILGAIIERQIDRFANEVVKVYKALDLNPLQKLRIVLRNLIHPEKMNDGLTKHVEDDRDTKLHQRLERKVFEKFNPIVKEIIKQGIEEEIFDTNFPEEITEILFIGIQGYLHLHYPSFSDKEIYERKTNALEELLERALDLQRGSIKFQD